MKKLILIFVALITFNVTNGQDPNRYGNFVSQANFHMNKVAKQIANTAKAPIGYMRTSAGEYARSHGYDEIRVWVKPASEFNHNGGLGVKLKDNEPVILKYDSAAKSWDLSAIEVCGNYVDRVEGIQFSQGANLAHNPDLGNQSLNIQAGNNQQGMSSDATEAILNELVNLRKDMITIVKNQETMRINQESLNERVTRLENTRSTQEVVYTDQQQVVNQGYAPCGYKNNGKPRPCNQPNVVDYLNLGLNVFTGVMAFDNNQRIKKIQDYRPNTIVRYYNGGQPGFNPQDSPSFNLPIPDNSSFNGNAGFNRSNGLNTFNQMTGSSLGSL